MKALNPIRDKIVGKMIDSYGLKKTAGGVLMPDEDATTNAIRPRWFEVTHVGADNRDVKVGDYVLVEHGRWGRGMDLEKTSKKADLYFHIDGESILGVADENPL